MNTEQKKENEIFDGSQQQAKKESVEPKKENAPAVKSEQLSLPALPKKLVDAGFTQILTMPKKAFIASGGTEQQFVREVNFAVQLLMNSDYLFGCAKSFPDHFIEAIKNIALTGLTLNPELRLAYLVPYKGKVRFQSSYMGKVDILIRGGVVKWIEANLVYEKDKFQVIKGTTDVIVHEPDYFASDRGALRGGYWVAILPNGQKSFDVMPKSRIDAIKGRSEAVKSGNSSPWDTDEVEMQRKTIINWAFKSLPKSGLSSDMIKVLEIEGQFEREEFEDWKKADESKKDNFDEDGIQEAEVIQ